jgi:Calx-beta domain
LVFTVKLSARSVKRITVRYATSDGSAAAGTSYSATRGTLAFKRGQRVGRIRVPLIQSSTPSAAGTFYLALSHATNARITGAPGQGTILAHNLPAVFTAHAILTGRPGSGAGTGEFTMRPRARHRSR